MGASQSREINWLVSSFPSFLESILVQPATDAHKHELSWQSVFSEVIDGERMPLSFMTIQQIDKANNDLYILNQTYFEDDKVISFGKYFRFYMYNRLDDFYDTHKKESVACRSSREFITILMKDFAAYCIDDSRDLSNKELDKKVMRAFRQKMIDKSSDKSIAVVAFTICQHFANKLETYDTDQALTLIHIHLKETRMKEAKLKEDKLKETVKVMESMIEYTAINDI